MRAAPDASAELVKLRETEALGVFHEEDVRVRHVDADFDHRRCNERLRVAGGECAHRGVLVLGLHAAVEESARVRCEKFPPFLELRARGLRLEFLGFLDERVNDVGLAPGLDLLAEKRGGLGQLRDIANAGDDFSASGGHLVDHGHVEVAVSGLRKRAGNRRGGHHEDIGSIRAGDELRALEHAELVLLVDNDEPGILELVRLEKQCMRADDKLGSALEFERTGRSPRARA